MAIYHLNMPKESFLGDDNHIGLRYHLHGDMDFEFDKFKVLTARFALMGQKNNLDLNLGAQYEYFFIRTSRESLSAFGGLMMRIGDALIFVAGGEYGNLRVGFSYDLNISSLAPASKMNGGFEISVIYTGIFVKKTGGLKCPRI